MSYREITLSELKMTNSLDDEFKRRTIAEYHNNFTPWQLEELFKNGVELLKNNATLKAEIESLEEEIDELEYKSFMSPTATPISFPETLNDVYKKEFFLEYQENYTPWELEKLLQNGKELLKKL